MKLRKMLSFKTRVIPPLTVLKSVEITEVTLAQ